MTGITLARTSNPNAWKYYYAAYEPTSNQDSSSKADSGSQRKSSISSVMDKAKSKFSRKPSDAESIASDDVYYEKQKAQELERQRRKAENEQTTLRNGAKFGARLGKY
jgi:hypothetical protein